MKKIYLAILLVIVAAGSGYSQQLIATPNDSAEITAVVTDEWEPNDIHLALLNNTSSTVTFTWGLVNYNTPAGWEVKLCDNNGCYDLTINGGPYVTDTVSAGDTMDFKFQYSSHLLTGTGSTNVYAYITGDSANTAISINYKANLSYVSGLADHSAVNTLSISPNPAQHSFAVSGVDKALSLSYSVYDLKGALMPASAKTGNGETRISTETLPAGEYILKAFDASGKIAGTSRFNKVD